ncbi:hypothetical protein Gogos_021354 [Gossypium gossypioides]|uniref:Receptor-like protein 12 n=1 Tax=Gossypium gossypioides TaxID=34282 RepID=A0A7J9D792_GOSGO|nr:hypothetical protein [Gossypium gossypioides]
MDFSSNFLQGTLPNNISGLSYLRELYLSANLLSGRVPGWLCSLPSLEYLDLHSNKLNGPIDPIQEPNLVQERRANSREVSVCSGPSLQLLQGPLPTPPQALRYFLISNNGLVGEIPSKICNLSFLYVLDLSKNKLGGTIPDCSGTFSNQLSMVVLRTVNLNGNQLEGSIPQSLTNCHRLEVLDLGNNNINDTFPYWVGTLPNLKVLVLRSNRFHGDMQNFNGTFSFSSLRMIDLSRNEFTGHIPPELFENLKSMKDIPVDKSGPKYMGGDYYQDSVIITLKGLDFKLERILTSFTVIDFSSNHFKGSIPKEVGELNSLIVLNFSHNSLAGNIPPSLGKMAALESLDLSSNKLQGRIPVQLTDLTFLGALNLCHNNLDGQIPLANHFDTFSNDSFDGNPGLCGFPLSKKCGNNQEPESAPSTVADESERTLVWKIAAMGYGSGLVLGLSMGYIVFTTGRPRWLFSSCNMQRFPSFLNASKYLQVLDLSNNQIHGSITKWEAEGWEGLLTLNLSMNFLTTVEQIPGKHLFILDLRSNSLRGLLPTPPQALCYFLISNNELDGEIPSKICNLRFLYVLDLSKNKLGGTIPDCFGTFSGQLSVDLRTLNLNGNQLEGSIPQSLKNCYSLEVLDLGNNNINDTFPYWLGTLTYLEVLVLRSNRFHGDIQNFNGTFSFSSLQVIDLSRNEFTGHIPPELFENLKSMKDIQVDKSGPVYIGADYYHDSITVTMKGSDFELARILTIFTIIDFSSNHFKGPIPKAIGELNSLIVLNFSHNSLTVNIPPSLGKLAALESLDLSSNKLQGRIPMQLTNLTFLGALNLSHNNLEGPIPLANHFDTFSNDSFAGNSGLCGFPLSKTCGNDQEPKSPPSTVADESEIALIWKIAAMGYGSGVVLGLSVGYIVFTTGRPRWLVKMMKRNPEKRMRRRIHRNGRRKN